MGKPGANKRQRKSWLGWTVDTLKSTLQSHGVTIPVKRQPKAYYQAVYQELILGVGGDKARSGPVTNLDSSTETVTPSPVHSYNTRGVNRPVNLDTMTQAVLASTTNTSGANMPVYMDTSTQGILDSIPNTSVNSGLRNPNIVIASQAATMDNDGQQQNVVNLPARPRTAATDLELVSALQSINQCLQRLEGSLKQGHPTDTVLPNGSGQITVCQQTSAGAGGRPTATIHQEEVPRRATLDIYNRDNTQDISVRTLPAYPNYGPSSDSLPHVEIVNENVRREIISGKNVNLASLLIPGVSSAVHDLQGRNMMLGEILIPLKPDKRMTKALTITEFINAFTTYRNVTCDAYPHRRPELDMYLKDMIDMSTRFGGTGFYEYHKLFSSRASALLQSYNVKVDWSQRDTRLYTTVFAGCRANSCGVCHSIEHMTDFCPLTAYNDSASYQKKGGPSLISTGNNPNQLKRSFPSAAMATTNSNYDSHGRPRVRQGGKEICNNYNVEIGCNRPNCGYVHACLTCRASTHGAYKCSRATHEASQSSTNTTNNKVNNNKKVMQ